MQECTGKCWIVLFQQDESSWPCPSLIWTSAKHCPAQTFPAPGWKTFWGLSLSMPHLATCRLSANHEFFYAKAVCTWGIIQCISFLYLPLDSPPAQLQLWTLFFPVKCHILQTSGLPLPHSDISIKGRYDKLYFLSGNIIGDSSHCRM